MNYQSILRRMGLALILITAAGCQGVPQNVPPSDNVTVHEEVKTMPRTVAGQRLTYLEQSPAGSRPDEGWPLLLFLHGYGECGTDINKVRKHGPPKLIEAFPELQSAVVISPQCPPNSWWRVEALRALVVDVAATRGDIDLTRLYVTGLSMGGYGIWSFVSHYPDFFAGAVPICGGGDPFRLPANRPPEKTGIRNEFDPDGLRAASGLPLWTFHGTEDTSVPIGETKGLVALMRAGGNESVQFTTYEGVGHVGAWERAYEDPALWAWLFAQRRAPRPLTVVD